MTKFIPFTKMHGLGNDFVIINALSQPLSVHELPIAKLANRHTGIGFDQLLMLEKSKEADLFCRIFNADGSEAEQCGNGLRCVARFLHENRIHQQMPIRIETKAGIFPAYVEDYEHIRVMMNSPVIKQPLMELSLMVAGQPLTLPISIISLGNPHAIVKVASISDQMLGDMGLILAQHPQFAEGVNVGFIEVLNTQHVRLRTFERGAGETCACGTNACAAVVAGILNQWLNSPVQVEFLYGSLFISWESRTAPVQMIGSASKVFAGEMCL